MSAVLFRCPTTGQTIDIQLETDRDSMKQISNEAMKVICPHCGETHTFLMGDARLRDRLKD